MASDRLKKQLVSLVVHKNPWYNLSISYHPEQQTAKNR